MHDNSRLSSWGGWIQGFEGVWILHGFFLTNCHRSGGHGYHDFMPERQAYMSREFLAEEEEQARRRKAKRCGIVLYSTHIQHKGLCQPDP